MILGEKSNVLCYDGIYRTGTAIYITPHYVTFEFEGRGGKFREAIPSVGLTQAKNKTKGRPYTEEEDTEIISNNDDAKIAKNQNRTVCAIKARRKVLRRIERDKQRIV